MEQTKLTGKVKFYSMGRGYGFLIDDQDNSREYFFHVTGLTNGLVKKDDKVEFELQTTKRGVKAVRIKKLDVV